MPYMYVRVLITSGCLDVILVSGCAVGTTGDRISVKPICWCVVSR